MNGIVYHIVSGQAFFSGIILLICAAVASIKTRPVFRRVSGLLAITGLIAIAISSTAIPYWYYAVAAIATIAWIGSAFRKSKQRPVVVMFVVVWLIAGAIELPWHTTPALQPTANRHIAVIGDSVSAGVDDSETWPNILAREHNLTVQDISHVGETTASALKRVKQTGIDARL